MLVLDSEALSALANGPEARRDRVRALAKAMRARDEQVVTVAAVLAEVVRGHPRDAGVFAGLRRERVVVLPVDSRVAIRAGRLLGAAGRGSKDAIDAFVVAAADLEGGALIATVDTADMSDLAAHAMRVRVANIA
jgi:predicted nucleic acid-binding protein